MSCSKCKEYNALFNKEPRCGACDRPKIDDDDDFVYYLICQYGHLLVNDGQVSPSGFVFVFDIENIPKALHRKLTIDISSYLNTYMENKYGQQRPKDKSNSQG